MSGSTRSQGPAILKYIIETVFGEPPDGDLIKGLKRFGVLNHMSLMTISEEKIEKLEYLDDSNTKIELHDGHKSLVKIFQAYMHHYDLDSSDIMDISSDQFDYFRVKFYNPNAPISRTTTSTSTTTSATTPFTRNPANEFRKSVKRDKTQYSALKTEKQWDSWKRSTIATARAHGCEDIFDPGYTPKSGDDHDIFQEKQKFIYSVFEEMLQTDMGKHLVRLHENDFDAHTIFKKLSNHAKTSTQASIDTADLLSYITSVKLHTSNWRGTKNAFILHWCDKVRVYESLVQLSDHFTSNVKLIMLQNAVAGISELNQVKVQSFHDEVHGKCRLSYDEYKSLLLSAATTYDAKRGLSKGRAARTVNESEIMADTIV